MTEAIKALLREHNISQRQVAERMGIKPQTLVSRLKAQELSLSTLQGIADAIDMELAELCAIITKAPTRQMEEIEYLRRENELLKALLEEKERFIEMLVTTKKERG